MVEIRRLMDILKASKSELIEDFDGNLRALFLYGSFSYQDLQAPVNEFNRLYGKGGLLDKKPDLMAVVSNLETAVRGLATRYLWTERNIDQILDLRPDTPCYFNLTTWNEYELDLNGKVKAPLPYKLGLIEASIFSIPPEPRNYNIYLASRLSKFVNIIYQAEDFQETVRTQLDIVRDYFVNLTLRTLPKRFSGEEFARRYLQVTYLAEAYRVFALLKSKHISILNSKVYDLEGMRLVSMRDQLRGILEPRLQNKKGIFVESQEHNFYNSVFFNENESTNPFYDFLRFNCFSLGISFGKNRVTNAIGGSNNLAYVLRKFR